MKAPIANPDDTSLLTEVYTTETTTLPVKITAPSRLIPFQLGPSMIYTPQPGTYSSGGECSRFSTSLSRILLGSLDIQMLPIVL